MTTDTHIFPDRTPGELQGSGRNIAEPFRLRCGNTPIGDVMIEKVFRLLPGKRLTALARWNGRPAVIKLFFDPSRWQSHFQTELKGHQLTTESGAPTPAMLAQHEQTDAHWGAILYEYIDHSVSLRAYWLHTHESIERKLILEKLATITARLHLRFNMQWDNHLDNFIIRSGQIFLVDCGGVEHKGYMSFVNALNNLAMLCAQFPWMLNADLMTVLQVYLDTRDLSGQFEEMTVFFIRQCTKQRHARINAYLDKCQRECTEIITTKPARGMSLTIKRELASEGMIGLLTEPHALVDNSRHLKTGNSQTVAIASLNDTHMVIKRYNIKNTGHWLRRIGRRTRARNAWMAAHGFELLNIPTPRPVALLETGYGIFHGPSFYISAYCEGPTLLEAVERADRKTISIYADQMCAIFISMILNRITHGDTKATNFIVDKSRVVVIDLDAVEFHKNQTRFFRKANKDLERFMRNWRESSEAHTLFARALAPAFELVAGKFQ